MLTIWRGFTLAGMIALLGVGTCRAQGTPRGLVEVQRGGRAGFWGGVGVGAGGESFDLLDGVGYSSELYKPTVSLRLGGTVNQHLRLGGELLTWIDDRGEQTASLSSFLFIAQAYPASGAGFYLKGGLGVGRNAVDFRSGFDVGDTGFAGLVGAGWELRLGRRVYLNPAVDLAEHRYTGRGGDRYHERLLNFGLGVLFQSGR
jgi:hypothetical protein